MIDLNGKSYFVTMNEYESYAKGDVNYVVTKYTLNT